MHGYFSFQVESQSRLHRTLVVFIATSAPVVDEVMSVIRERSVMMLSPDAIILMGFDSESAQLDDISKDSRLRDCVPSCTRHSDPPPIICKTIGRMGLPDTALVGELSWQLIRFAGLTAIFQNRNALLVCPPTYHFSKPSGRHADRFIWAANTLVDGAEIMFIAAQCLRYVGLKVRHYYCDTGAIGSLAFAIDSLLRRFDREANPGTINTFGSYDGLKTFEFRDCDSSIVLLSASTSGGLEKEIIVREPLLSPENIITIFGVSTKNGREQILLDVTQTGIAAASADLFRSHLEDDCPHCRSSSIAVPMQGDQFIPSRSETRSVLVCRSDAPTWLSRFLAATGRKHLLKAHYRSPNSLNAAATVFVDLESVVGSWNTKCGIGLRLRRLIDQTIPVATRRIVHLDDPASTLLAERVRDHLTSCGVKIEEIEVEAAADARDLAVLTEGATVVVAAAVASGHSLLGMSQTLREIQNTNALSYLVGLMRMPSTADEEKLEKDLRMGETAHDFSFHCAESIKLPLESHRTTTPWDEELLLLKNLANEADADDLAKLEVRIRLLLESQSPNLRGLSERLFWCRPDGKELCLRRGFVFFPAEMADGSTECSQGDVFFAITSVLHNMRRRDRQGDSLWQTEYERRVISPLTFDRFNDGILQAAILRAAKPPELNYAASVDESHSMTVILQSILNSVDQQKGEAAREFLLAIALRRLTLTPTDLQTLIDDFSDKAVDWLCRILWETIISDVHEIGES